MSYEDDEYWDEEYSARAPVSYVDTTAVARERRPSQPEPVLPTRRSAGYDPAGYDSARYDVDIDASFAPDVDELAARRKRRRQTGNSRSPRPGFDTERPGWLDDPDFVPIDVSAPDLAGPDSAVLDFNRPELGANFDAPEFTSSRRATDFQQRRPVPRVEDDWDDEIDEPFDHRVGMDRSSTLQPLAPESRSSYGFPDDRDADDEPIRRTGGHRYAEPGDREPRPAGPDRARRRSAPPAVELPATGRARVPQPPVEDVPDLDELGLPRTAASARTAFVGDDDLDLYRPRRSDGRRDDDARREPEQPAETWQGGSWADKPAAALAGYSTDRQVADDAESVESRREPAAAALGATETSPTGEDTDGDGPRVLSRAAPPTTPRIISKAAPPAVPKVIKKVEPPAPPRVISVTPTTVPPLVAKPAEPAASGSPAAPATDNPELTHRADLSAFMSRPEADPLADTDPAGWPRIAPGPDVAGPAAGPAPMARGSAPVSPAPVAGSARVGTPRPPRSDSPRPQQIPPDEQTTRSIRRGPRVAALGAGEPGSADSWQLDALPPSSRRTSMPAPAQPGSAPIVPLGATPPPQIPAPGYPSPGTTRPAAPPYPGGPDAQPGPATQATPPEALDRRDRVREPYAVPPTATPPQVRPRADPTPVNGYPRARGQAAPAPVVGRAAPSLPAADPAASAPAPAPAFESAPRPEQNPAADAAPQPVVRIPASDTDTDTPRRYADADLGNSWFKAKPGPQNDKVTETAGTPAQDSAAATGSGTDTAPDTSVVLDVDLTGLLNGLTAEQAIIAAGTSDAPQPVPDDGKSPDGKDQARGQSLTPGPEPTEPKTPQRHIKPLSPADLEAIRWRLDGATLREVVDDRDALRELGDRLDEPLSDETDNVTRSGLLCVRAEVYRLLGELGIAASASRLAFTHAESARDTQAMVIAQAELAHVLRLRGDFAEADRLFEEAASSEVPEELRSVVHENAGRSCFDQGRNMEALDHFARAIRLGRPDDLDLVERIDVCLEAVYIHVLRDGWGPYPRLRRQIIGPVRPPKPAPNLPIPSRPV